MNQRTESAAPAPFGLQRIVVSLQTSARWRNALGIAWVVLIPLAVLGPALFTHPSALVDPVTGDQANEIQPWLRLAWTEIHHGHLPLWNPYSVLGAPLAFNWQSGAFGLPALVGYAVPIGWAFTAGTLTTLVVGGTGAYVLGRVVGIGAFGCAAGATFYELSGPFLGWLGWPVASVMSWAPWLFALALLVVRGQRRRSSTILIAVVVALAVYAGQPDTLILLATGFGVFVLALFLQRAPRWGGSGPVLRPALDLVAAGVAGVALSAPLWLPGLQVASRSIRGAKTGTGALSPHFYTSIIVPRFDGVPLSGSTWLGGATYVQGVSYIGIAALLLAALGLARRWKSVEVRAFMGLAIVSALLTFFPPLEFLARQVAPSVQWTRMSLLLVLAFAVFVALGIDELAHRDRFEVVGKRLVAGLGAGALLLLVLWLGLTTGLTGFAHSIRSGSFLWPAVTTGAALVAMVVIVFAARAEGTGLTWLRGRQGTASAVVLLLCETGLLIAAGAPLWTAATPDPNGGQRAIARTVGSSLLGFGVNRCFPYSLGIVQNQNLDYRVQELDVYDPMTPKAYYQSYRALTGMSGGLVGQYHTNLSFFCPQIDSLTVARRFGVRYVIEPHGTRSFDGTVFVTSVKTGDIYRVPGAASATLVPDTGVGRTFPDPDTSGRPVPVSHPGPASWTVRTQASSAQVLRLRLTDLPGWHATLDGHPLKLHPFGGVMLQARIPAGAHVVELRYRPTAFSAGLVLAGIGVVGMVLYGVLALGEPPGRGGWPRRRPDQLGKA